MSTGIDGDFVRRCAVVLAKHEAVCTALHPYTCAYCSLALVCVSLRGGYASISFAKVALFAKVAISG